MQMSSFLAKMHPLYPEFFQKKDGGVLALHREMIARGQWLALAESCTGGAVAARIVSVEGASRFFLGSIVAYANSWKEQFLGVQPSTLQEKGAVSQEVVREMAYGLLEKTVADFSLAISGCLGSAEQNIVFFAIAKRGEKIDAGSLGSRVGRSDGIELAVQVACFALWQRIVFNKMTFSNDSSISITR